MKAPVWTAGFAAVVTLAASGVCGAEVGLLDGKDSFSDFESTKSRAEVQQEYVNARAEGLLPIGSVEFWTPDTSVRDIGARGPAGSRYQARTREEVLDELREYHRIHKPNDPNDIYFGG